MFACTLRGWRAIRSLHDAHCAPDRSVAREGLALVRLWDGATITAIAIMMLALVAFLMITLFP